MRQRGGRMVERGEKKERVRERERERERVREREIVGVVKRGLIELVRHYAKGREGARKIGIYTQEKNYKKSV